MRKTVTMHKAALLGGVVALAATLPLTTVQAGELMRLDSAQLDSVTAAAEAGIGLFAVGAAFGSINSLSVTTFSGQSQSGPALSTASGFVSQFNLGIGGANADADSQTGIVPSEFAGDRFYIYNFDRDGSGPGYAWSYNATAAFAVGSEFPVL